MNIHQFKYVLAVVDSKNFEHAAKKCFVSQSTLSTMINRFEDEIGIRIFNRRTKPVSITKEGKLIINRLRSITKEIDLLNNEIQVIKGEMVGNLSIGIIPTIAPYLLPRFINEYSEQFPKLNIVIKEMTTEQIQKGLLARDLDVGIVALSLDHRDLVEIHLYDEPFLLYDCTGMNKKGPVAPNDLDYTKMCLLEKGHCLRTQVYDICKLSEQHLDRNVNYRFDSGSMDSLIQITQSRQGITILPFLSYYALSDSAKERIVHFREPVPGRKIGLVTHAFFVKKALVESLEQVIQRSIKNLIPKTTDVLVVDRA